MLRYVDEEENENRYNRKAQRPDSPILYDEMMEKIPWYHKFMLNRPVKVVFVAFLVAVICPPIFYFLFFISLSETPLDSYSTGTCAHTQPHRVQCGTSDITEAECLQNCCYDQDDERCYHRLPSRFNYIQNEDMPLVPRFLDTPYNTRNLERLKLRIDEVTSEHLNIIIYDDSVLNYEPERVLEDKDYRYNLYAPEFFIDVFATDENRHDAILSTTRGPLIASENIWEWSVMLSDDFNYGFDELPIKGESMKTFYGNAIGANFFPVITAHKNGSFHALIVENSGPFDLTILESNLIVIKSILGQSLSLHLFIGPEPRDVTKQILEYIGHVPEIDYWMLGVHFCRSNMADSVEHSLVLEEKFRSDMLAANIPYESDCIDADLLSALNTLESNSEMDLIRTAVVQVKKDKKRFLASLAPFLIAKGAIYEDANAASLLVLEPETQSNLTHPNRPYLGLVDETEVVYFDYFSPEIEDFIKSNWIYENLTDGFYLRDNWPLNDELKEEYSHYNFPYFTDELYNAFNATLPWNARHPGISQGSNLHIAHHNSYGKAQSDIILQIFKDTTDTQVKHPLLFTSSANLNGRGIYAWQNATSSWKTLKEAFIFAALGALSGTVQATPICGDSLVFSNELQENLCVKWYLASSFLPIFHVHSNDIPRDPLAFTGHITNAIANAIRTRYKLLPYFYGVLSKQEPLLRPMFYEFHEDERFLEADEQFMVGEALLIAPNFLPNRVSVNVTLPTNETWYEFSSGHIITGTENRFVIIPTTETDIVVFVRGGYVIPMHESVFSTADETRQKSNYTLVVALDCNVAECRADGRISITGAEEIEIRADSSKVTINLAEESLLCDNSTEIALPIIINTIKVYGLAESANNFDLYYHITNLNANICDDDLTIEYF